MFWLFLAILAILGLVVGLYAIAAALFLVGLAVVVVSVRCARLHRKTPTTRIADAASGELVEIKGIVAAEGDARKIPLFGSEALCYEVEVYGGESGVRVGVAAPSRPPSRAHRGCRGRRESAKAEVYPRPPLERSETEANDGRGDHDGREDASREVGEQMEGEEQRDGAVLGDAPG